VKTRRLGLLFVAGLVVLALSIPVLAASPSPSASSEPSKPPKTEKPDKAAKPERAKTPEVPISITGTVKKVTDASGNVTYTVVVAGKTWTLSAGPPWFWGDKNPLNFAVGKLVTVAGDQEGDAEVDVDTIDGKAIREPGKPPWAGGPWVVGPSHPGWKSWMADGKPGKGHGREKAPGQLKQASPTP
jgi:hypothetical protein